MVQPGHQVPGLSGREHGRTGRAVFLLFLFGVKDGSPDARRGPSVPGHQVRAGTAERGRGKGEGGDGGKSLQKTRESYADSVNDIYQCGPRDTKSGILFHHSENPEAQSLLVRDRLLLRGQEGKEICMEMERRGLRL